MYFFTLCYPSDGLRCAFARSANSHAGCHPRGAAPRVARWGTAAPNVAKQWKSGRVCPSTLRGGTRRSVAALSYRVARPVRAPPRSPQKITTER